LYFFYFLKNLHIFVHLSFLQKRMDHNAIIFNNAGHLHSMDCIIVLETNVNCQYSNNTYYVYLTAHDL